MKYFLLLGLCSTTVLQCIAQTNGVKPATSYAKTIAATRTQPENKKGNDSYSILIVWKSADQPEFIFWRGERGWLSCDMAKAHKNPNPEPGESWYTTEDIDAAGIKKGDTLEIVPVPGGKFAIPKEIPATAKNVLFLKTPKTGWLSLPVNNIKLKKED
jgi:hypothetical protein